MKAINLFSRTLYEQSLAKQDCPDTFIDIFVESDYENVVCNSKSIIMELRQYNSYPESELQIKNKVEILEILNNGNYVLTSSLPRYNGNSATLSLTEKELLDKAMTAYLKARKIKFLKVIGMYEGSIIPFGHILLDLSKGEANKLASAFAQYSIIHGNHGVAKIEYRKGSFFNRYNIATSWSEVSSENENYTLITLSNGEKFKFTLNFDFENFYISNYPF